MRLVCFGLLALDWQFRLDEGIGVFFHANNVRPVLFHSATENDFFPSFPCSKVPTSDCSVVLLVPHN